MAVPKTTIHVRWRGAELNRRMRSAAVMGIDDTMAACEVDAKADHPGWKNVTGTAEGSIMTVDKAKHDIRGAVGRWGSTGVNYMLMLELKRGSALRMSAQANYPDLSRRIAFHMGGIL